MKRTKYVANTTTLRSSTSNIQSSIVGGAPLLASLVLRTASLFAQLLYLLHVQRVPYTCAGSASLPADVWTTSATPLITKPRHPKTNSPSQITEIAHRAITAHNGPDDREPPQAETDPFTFKVPVMLAGLQLHAEFMVSVFQPKVPSRVGRLPWYLGCCAWGVPTAQCRVFQRNSTAV